MNNDKTEVMQQVENTKYFMLISRGISDTIDSLYKLKSLSHLRMIEAMISHLESEIENQLEQLIYAEKIKEKGDKNG